MLLSPTFSSISSQPRSRFSVSPPRPLLSSSIRDQPTTPPSSAPAASFDLTDPYRLCILQASEISSVNMFTNILAFTFLAASVVAAPAVEVSADDQYSILVLTHLSP
jgi:hypothetical protein